jgi:hypothetical protein
LAENSLTIYFVAALLKGHSEYELIDIITIWMILKPTHVCMYECMYLHMNVCTYVCTYLCINV